MRRESIPKFAVCSLSIIALAGCSRESASTTASASASAAASPSSSNAQARANVPPFPGNTAPTNARVTPGGLKYVVQKQGTAQPNMKGVMAHYALWTKDAKVNRSSFGTGEIPFPIGFFPDDIQWVLKRVGTGGRFVLWLPEGHLEQWRAPKFPKADVIALLDLKKLYTPPQPTVSSVGGAGDEAETPRHVPDGPSPPAKAKRTSDGLRYALLSEGKGDRPAPTDRMDLRVRGWAYEGLKRRQVLANTQLMLAPAQAPARLGPVLETLGAGSYTRVWLPKKLAAEVVPHHSGDLILDIEVASIERPK